MAPFIMRLIVSLLLLETLASATPLTFTGEELVHQQLFKSEKIKVMYTLKDKQEKADGYIKAINAHSVTVGKGIWREEIPFDKIISVELARQAIKIGSRLRVIEDRTLTGNVISIEDNTIAIETSSKDVQQLQFDDWQQIQVESRIDVLQIKLRGGPSSGQEAKWQAQQK